MRTLNTGREWVWSCGFFVEHNAMFKWSVAHGGQVQLLVCRVAWAKHSWQRLNTPKTFWRMPSHSDYLKLTRSLTKVGLLSSWRRSEDVKWTCRVAFSLKGVKLAIFSSAVGWLFRIPEFRSWVKRFERLSEETSKGPHWIMRCVADSPLNDPGTSPMLPATE
jgi:hypothetical protein